MEENDGAYNTGPVISVADGIEWCANGTNNARNINEAGSQLRESE